VLALGCGHGKKPAGGESGSATSGPSSAAKTQTGVIEGVVRLADGADLPSYPSQSMERSPLTYTHNAPLPESCSPPKTTDRQPVQLTADGALAGVMVAVTGFSKAQQRPPQVHEVSIEDCRLTPSLVVAMKGDTLRVRNTVDYPFMPTYRERGMARSLIPGQTYDVALDKPGVEQLLCGFTAPCGRTDVIVLLHPLYATTNGQGKFHIEGVPPDEPLTINAWHPLFQESKVQVQVERGERKSVELVLIPKPPPASTTTAAPQKPSEPPHESGAKKPTH
jgi:hypothetical protein